MLCCEIQACQNALNQAIQLIEDGNIFNIKFSIKKISGFFAVKNINIFEAATLGFFTGSAFNITFNQPFANAQDAKMFNKFKDIENRNKLSNNQEKLEKQSSKY